MEITLNKVCTKLNTMLNDNGFDSRIDRDDFIAVDLGDTFDYLDHCFIRVQDNKILLFTTIETANMLQNSSMEDVAFAMSVVAYDYAKDGIELNIKEGTIIISSLIRITLFTSSRSIYNKIYKRLIYCASAHSSLLHRLKC